MRNEKQLAVNRERIRERRMEAKKKGVKLPSDRWAAENPDKHREKTSRWRKENSDKSLEISRANQRTRRSTPWGRITNRVWPILHKAVRANSNREGKYTRALGYKWSELRSHLESQFVSGMNWDNWGEHWELDHIKPVSVYRYDSIEDEAFKMCWSLNNLRPLLRSENQSKGAKS